LAAGSQGFVFFTGLDGQLRVGGQVGRQARVAVAGGVGIGQHKEAARRLLPDKIGQRGQRFGANDKGIFHYQATGLTSTISRKETPGGAAFFTSACNHIVKGQLPCVTSASSHSPTLPLAAA